MLRIGLLVAVLSACVSQDSGSTSPDASTCVEGNRVCDGLVLKVCRAGELATTDVCETACEASLGCTSPPVDLCSVPLDELDAMPTCDETAPPGSFNPETQWIWEGPPSRVIPLVANMTDDNGDGVIDLCDTPDVVVSAEHIYFLDGATGALHYRSEAPVDDRATHAIGDIDGDQIPEVVAIGEDFKLIAFNHDGSVLWRSEVVVRKTATAIALADLDADGTVEIIADTKVVDHLGSLEWEAQAKTGIWSAPTAADLDGDGLLEVVYGNSAYRHNGIQYYLNEEISEGWPAVADFDNDGAPEVLVTYQYGISLLDADGTTIYANRLAVGNRSSFISPAAVGDFDGDGNADFAISSEADYGAYSSDATPQWTAPIDDDSGISCGSAFDFLGDGTPEALYSDEQSMFVFNDQGEAYLDIPRVSRTWIEYPVVADIDNDGSAEIIVTSNAYPGQDPYSPTVRVIRDVDNRWIQARRIWNQHTYHVTNVREDGTIPQNESPSWLGLNTFRINSQLEAGRSCRPPIL